MLLYLKKGTVNHSICAWILILIKTQMKFIIPFTPGFLVPLLTWADKEFVLPD